MTRREEVFLAAAGVLAAVLVFIPQEFINRNEELFLLLIVAPLGVYIATDPLVKTP